MDTFSVVIPAYNCASTLQRAVESVLHQLGEDDEIIIVDDCSTDETFEIANKLVADDRHVKVFKTARNSGCLAARCEGVLRSSCTRVIFLDGDDEYYGNALRVIRDALDERNHDIVHFGIDMWVAEAESSHLDEAASRWFDPHPGRLDGLDVFSKCFVERKYNWNLANKCFDANLCRKACCFLPPHRIQRGEDTFLYFVIAYFAKSYLGLKGANLYRYNFGLGQDSFRSIRAKEYAGFCDSADAAKAIASFLRNAHADNIYWTGYDKVRYALAEGCANKLRDQLVKAETREGVQVFMEKWGRADAVSALAASYRFDPTPLAKSIGFDECKPLKPGDTIASFYWSFTGGGAENVQRMLVELWRSLGFNVMLLMEREPDARAIENLGADYRVIPQASAASYRERLLAFERAVDEFDVKGVVYHQWIGKSLFWDMMTFKSMGIPFYIHCHGIFTHCIANGDPYFSCMPWVYRHADAVVSLSEVDASFWRRFNPRTFTTVNPSLFSPSDLNPSSIPAEKRVLWLGRLSPEKRPMEGLEVFAKVLESVPDAKMDFVGGAPDANYQQSVFSRARDLGIEHAVNLVGWSDEQKRYYDRARVFLMTSDPKEGYPLTLGECQALGVPCVMYDLPYLTLTREGGGICAVPFGDEDAAAEAVVHVLEDDGLYSSLRLRALELAARLESFDFGNLWRTILMSKAQPKPEPRDDETENIAWSTLLSAYELGQPGKLRQIESLRAEVGRINRALDTERRRLDETRKALAKQKKKSQEYKSSHSWRIGRAITGIPRWVRRTAGKLGKRNGAAK